MKRAVFIADLDVLQQYDPAAIVRRDDDTPGHLECKESSSVSINSSINQHNLIFKNWSFQYQTTGNISDSVSVNSFIKSVNNRLHNSNDYDECDYIHVHGRHLHVPPMIFGNNVLSLSYLTSDLQIKESLSFSAFDSIYSWANLHLDPNNVEVLQVPYASEWNIHHQHNVNTTDSVFVAEVDASVAVDISSSKPRLLLNNQWDWTYNTNYCFTHRTNNYSNEARLISMVDPLAYIVNISELRDNNSKWIRCSENGIDLNMLKSTDDPILFYLETLLYQDDLEDCGEVVSGDIKIRVMPTCWYILYRVFVRVDGLVVKLRDTRLFHKYQTNEIHVDVTLKELSINNDSIPSHMLRDPSLMNDRMNIVNEKEGIGRYYKLILDT